MFVKSQKLRRSNLCFQNTILAATHPLCDSSQLDIGTAYDCRWWSNGSMRDHLFCYRHVYSYLVEFVYLQLSIVGGRFLHSRLALLRAHTMGRIVVHHMAESDRDTGRACGY